MTKQRIVICEDDPKRASGWSTNLSAITQVATDYEILVPSPAEIEDALRALQSRRRQMREDGRADEGALMFDEADILVVDYDLFGLDSSQVDTGERVAYLARCYSKCGYIIEINQFGINWFDLTLRDHPLSFADLNLGGDQLHNPGLWAQPFEGFRPWCWPLLPSATRSLRRRTDQIRGHLDVPILEVLGIDRSIVEVIPRSVMEYLGEGASPTFRDCVRKSMLGLRPNDRIDDDDYLARIAAARVSKWIEYVVLPAQDVLVDAPHLARRFPSLLGADITQERLNASATLLNGADHLGLNPSKLGESELAAREWVSRPTWFWPSLVKNEDIAEVRDPWSTVQVDFEFCEDLSRFLPRSQVREFVADLPSPFVDRFVSDPQSEYAKRFRVNTGSDPRDIAVVDYRPAARLAA